MVNMNSNRLVERSTGAIRVGLVVLAAASLSVGCVDSADEPSSDADQLSSSVDDLRVASQGRASQIYRTYYDGDRLTDAGRIIDNGLRKYPADVYLIDLSGSMMSEVDVIRAFDFPVNAEVWAFNHTGLFKLFHPDEAISGGGTPLWESLVRVVTYYVDDPNGKSITVMTDGVDSGYTNSAGADPDGVIRSAKQRGLRINIIGAGEYVDDPYGQAAISEMKRIAYETGGGHFIRGEQYDDELENR